MWNSYKFKVFLNISLIFFLFIGLYVFLTDNREKNNLSFILLTLSGFLYPIQRLKKLKKENSNQLIMSIKTYKIIETILLFFGIVYYILYFTIDIPKPYNNIGFISVGVMFFIGKIIRKKENKLNQSV